MMVRLRVKQEATLADEDWLKLIFIKTPKSPVSILNAYYRIESERYPLTDNKPAVYGGLGSGNTYGLFRYSKSTWPPINISSLPYYEISKPLSTYSAASLGLPPTGGLRVKGQFHFDIEIEIHNKRKTLTTRKPEGISFIFNWLYPNKEQFQIMASRFKKLLRPLKEKRAVEENYLLSAFLKIPELSTGVPLKELIQFMEARDLRSYERIEIAKGIGRDHAKDPYLLAYVMDGLRALKSETLSDLYSMEIWDKSFVKPVGRYVEVQPLDIWTAIGLLHKHRSDWIEDQDFSKKLSAAVLRDYPEILLNLKETQVNRESEEKLVRWSLGLKLLGKTGDRRVIPFLRPALDNCRTFGSDSPESKQSICWCALIAIITILDGDFEKVWKDEMSTYNKQKKKYEAKSFEQEMIQKLKLRLNQMNVNQRS